MTDIDLLLNRYNPHLLASKVAENSKKMRILHNFTQKELAERSGMTLSSLKRFEQKGEISLSNMLKIAISLDATDGFEKLFLNKEANTLDEFLDEKNVKERKRVRKP